MTQWKISSQKSIFKAKLFDVQEVVFRNEKGEEKVHHVAIRDTIASVFPLNEKNEIYLLSEYRYTLGKRAIEAVAGHLDSGETAMHAAKRELKEEAGITALQMEEIARVEMSGSVFKNKAHLFLAKDLEVGVSHPEEDEDIQVIKMPLKEAVEKVMSGEINHASTMIGIMMLDKLKKEKKL